MHCEDLGPVGAPVKHIEPLFPVCVQEKTWKNRRSQRLDKMELLNLQSSLQSEIQAKQSIQDELRTSKARLVATEKYARDWQSTSIVLFTHENRLSLRYG